jgi:hypothetical protein
MATELNNIPLLSSHRKNLRKNLTEAELVL